MNNTFIYKSNLKKVMKHTVRVSIILVIAFLFSQLIGLGIITKYIDVEQTQITGEIEVKGLPYDLPRPEAEGGGTAVATIASAILVGTIVIFLIMKFGEVLWWKIWFFGAVSFALLFAFGAFIPRLYAALLAVTFAAIKIFKPNIYVHNIKELYNYV